MILLLGGARSGKSAAAVDVASASRLPVTFIATAEAGDDEMASRIARHREARPTSWATVDVPLELSAAVAAADPERFLIVDCLTLWVSNLLAAGRREDQVLAEGERLAALLRDRRAVVVSNEVGLGIVPDNEVARQYRDVLGTVNAAFSAAAARSLLMVAGRALEMSRVELLLGDS